MERSNPPLPQSWSDVWCLTVPGSWVFVEASRTDTPLHEVIRAVEASGTRVLVAHREPALDPEKIRIHVRVEASNPAAAAESVRRFGWNAVGTWPPEADDPELQDARDHLRHYLNL